MVKSVTITHTREEGTLLVGTSRGDGAAEAVKSIGWAWFRSIGVWGLRRSRDKAATMWQIEQAKKALEAAGFEVTVEIDDTARPTEVVEADWAARAEDRAAALGAKADRREADAERAWEREKAAHEALPPGGEPIKVGHHSEGRHRRAIDTAWKRLGQAVEAGKDAEEAARRARIAAAAVDARNSPVTVGNRIERLGAEIRSIDSDLKGRLGWDNSEPSKYRRLTPSPERTERLTAERAEKADQLAYWEGVRAAQIASGAVVDARQETVAKGDVIRVRNSWYEVLRSNKKTATVRSWIGSWTDTVPWHEVQEHRTAEAAAGLAGVRR